MRLYRWLPFALVVCVSLCARENLVNVYRLDSNRDSYRLVLKENWTFELTGAGGQQAAGNYVASDRKIGLVSGNLLRHFEYQIQNGDLLLRPSNTDGPEPNDLLGQMPPVQRNEQFTPYLTEAHYQQKYAAHPVVHPPVVPQPVVHVPVAGALTLEQIQAQAQTDSQYHAYMAAGTKAFSEKRYPEARAHFILANRFRPDAVEAKEHIALCDGVAALAEGDTARQRGDLRSARRAYDRAKQFCPALTAVADRQLATMGGFRPPVAVQPPLDRHTTGSLEADVVQQLRQARTTEALRLATTALQRDPNSLRVRSMKEGLEGLQMAEGLYQNLSTILGRARTHCGVVQKEEPLDGQTAQWEAQFAAQGQQVDARLSAARNRLVENPYAGLGNTLTDARLTANETAGLLEKARAVYAAKAAEVAKDDQLDLPFMTIKLDKESKRVKRLNGYADGFKALSAEAAVLAQ